MLKFLTHKLKTHSLNEENPAHHKVEDDDHDSGTESDDEQETSDEPEFSMESEGGSAITALSRSRSSLLTPASPNFLDSALPSDTDLGYDQHSSEEELEVINCSQQSSASSVKSNVGVGGGSSSSAVNNSASSVLSVSESGSGGGGGNGDNGGLVVAVGVVGGACESGDNISDGVCVSGSVNVVNGCSSGVSHTGQEKRKWSQVTPESSLRRTVGSSGRLDGVGPGSSGGSSDEETTVGGGGYQQQQPLSSSSSSSLSLSSPSLSTTPSAVVSPAPVQFRTSPPRGTHRPSSAALHDASPRKRHRNAAPPRPCLDFEKMQQLQARAMTAWRHAGDSTGELSIYCW